MRSYFHQRRRKEGEKDTRARLAIWKGGASPSLKLLAPKGRGGLQPGGKWG